MNECFKIAENIIKITEKSNDYVQQSNDYLLVAEVLFGLLHPRKFHFFL